MSVVTLQVSLLLASRPVPGLEPARWKIAVVSQPAYGEGLCESETQNNCIEHVKFFVRSFL